MPLMMTSGCATAQAFGKTRSGQRTTWNPADKAASITLSNGDLTATGTPLSGAANVRSTQAKTVGLWHAEVTVNQASSSIYPLVGIANAIASLTVTYPNTSILYQANGAVVYNGSTLATLATYTTGDTIAVEIDVGNSLVYFQKLGSSRSVGYSVPLITGPQFVMLGTSNAGVSNPDIATANFGATTFLVTPTAGYSAWNN